MASISSLTPAAFGPGRSVTISGSGLGTSGTVTIGGVAQPVTSWTDTAITFTSTLGSQSYGACRVDVVKGSGATAFFTDGFSSGDLTHAEGGASWLASTNTSVQSGRGNPGYALQYTFSTSAATIAEQRFDLGALYNELTIEFDIYIPNGAEPWGGAAYSHVNASPSNHKFFRLWGTDYADKEKIGASLFYESGYSEIGPEWDTGGGIGQKLPHGYGFISLSDLGKWMAVKIYIVAATSTTMGTMKIWKNGTLWIDATGTMNSYEAGEAHAYRYGYLLGAANGGFAGTTYMMIDNVRFYAGAV